MSEHSGAAARTNSFRALLGSMLHVFGTAGLVLVLVAVTAGPAAADSSTVVEPAPDLPATAELRPAELRIQVEGQGDARVTPDMVYVWIGVQTTAPTASTAQQKSAAVTSRVLDVLRRFAPPERIRTVEFQLYREERWSEAEQRSIPGNFVLRHLFEVPIDDLAKVATAVDQAIQAGANVVQNVEYTVKDAKQAQDDALRAAMLDAERKAKLLAAINGYTILRVAEIEESATFGPVFAAEGGSPVRAAVTPFMPGQLKVSAQLRVVFIAVPASR